MKQVVFICLVTCLVFNSCKVNYTFTGASISPEIKTVSVQFFPNQAPMVQPQLSNEFTETLKDKFVRQTSLELVNGIGDLNFEGIITGYDTKPVAIQQEAAAENRLTITIKVKYTNALEPDQSFETSFSAYEDYPSSQNLVSVEEDLMATIIEKIVEDIFNKSVANW
jgi:lipopolysaccharide assembly LptE-like protein